MAQGTPQPRLVQWLLDTRPLWPVSRNASSREQVNELKNVASRALALLSPSEQESVLRYYFLNDAKMSLASHLLKHLVITKYCGVAWSQSTISRNPHGKPCFVSEPRDECPAIDFNVSHQAGVVALLAVIGGDSKIQVGTDVVCVDERLARDHAYIEEKGYFDWVEMHGEVFADSEIEYMKSSLAGLDVLVSEKRLVDSVLDVLASSQWRNRIVPVAVMDESGSGSIVDLQSNAIIDVKIRRFYAMWCLREAYVKMTGEALAAPWLKDLEITDGLAPRASSNLSEVSTSLAKGETLGQFSIRFKGQLVRDIAMELVALGSGYMVAGALKQESGNPFVLSCWQQLDLENDVLVVAESITW